MGNLLFCAITSVVLMTTPVQTPVAGISANIENINVIYDWTTERVNLREEPNTKSSVIETLHKNERVYVLKDCGEWTQVIHNGTKGYIHKDYLKDKKPKSIDVTKEEVKMLQRITESECTGCSVEAKMDIASCIINRTRSNSFPDSIEGVIFQKSDGYYQFSPIGDNRYWEVEITDSTKKAVSEVLENGVIHDGLYFFNMRDVRSEKTKSWIDRKLIYLFTDDSGHSYYDERKGD
jgi:N-acetylmuramoyl-L-alanine amidase